MPYQAVLFDLFRTIVVYTAAAPTGKVREPQWRSAMEVLRPRAAQLLPGVDFERFLDSLVAASAEIARTRAPQHLEVAIEERYRRAMARLGAGAEQSVAAAHELSALQLAAQAANSTLPPAHRALLESLAGRFRIAVVSNFDHTRTVHDLLARLGVDRLFSAVVVSMEIGRRKPHPEIFRAALRRLATPAERALFVGDSLQDDIGGARSVGMDSVWVDRRGSGVPERGPKPTFVIRELPELEQILGRHR
jgi:putative hydrolase of the HAD superfamily